LPVKEPPSGPGWAHEIKYDGYRLHVRIANRQARLLTRTGLDWTAKYDVMAKTLAGLSTKAAYIDGELCALRRDGIPSFAALQAATDSRRSSELVYFAFDLLHLDGGDLMALPLRERKHHLQRLLANAPACIRYGEHMVMEGKPFWEAACRLGTEGVVSKRLDAPYVPNNRGLWRKAKCLHREEFVIVGFTDPEGSRLYLGALLLAYYTDGGKLVYAGRAGTGMSEAELRLRDPVDGDHGIRSNVITESGGR
jgi:bifunctional non-homologous end joining protein LigD